MEKWDLYNAKREKSGITVCRGEIIPKGLYHLSVSVWIVNQQGQYLLSQRHPKKQYPLYWECTGGSVLSGETSLQGAIREVKEELGILLTPGSEKLIYQSRRENVQDFYDVWLFHKDIKIEEMRLQETEVVDVQWVNPDKLFSPETSAPSNYLCRSANRLKKRRAQRYQSLCIWRFFFVLFPAFRTPFCGEQDNFIHLPAGHAEKPLISVDF